MRRRKEVAGWRNIHSMPSCKVVSAIRAGVVDVGYLEGRGVEFFSEGLAGVSCKEDLVVWTIGPRGTFTVITHCMSIRDHLTQVGGGIKTTHSWA